MAEELEQSLMQHTEKDFYQMFEIYNLTKEEVKTARDAVLEYCSKQEHLKDAVQYVDKTYIIEKLLQLSKGSIELCKQKFEAILTGRRMLPELLLNRNMEEFQGLFEIVNHCIMPKPTPNERCTVSFMQLQTSNIEKLSLLTYIRYILLIFEYTFYGYGGSAWILVFDMKNLPISIITKLDPNVIRKIIKFKSKYYKVKVKGIHLLNVPTFVDKILALFKIVLTPKLASRIYVHSSYEELYKHIPKEVLPKDYGGYEDSCSEIAAKWKALFESEEGQQKIQYMEKMVSDESKREKPAYNQDHLGISGTFKNLKVD